MKSASEAICLQEVPDEISLSLAISNCPCHCEGCHSEYLWEDCGRDALQVLKVKLNEVSEYITCVLFMGGDDDNQKDSLFECIKYIKVNYPNLKIALYSGFYTVDKKILENLDYLKVGPYIKSCGGLNKKTTNQRMYKINNGHLEDITYRFQEKPYL